MLKLSKDMDDDTRIKCLIAGWVAVDENCGELNPNSKPLRLRRSHGRRKAGRPTKYWLLGTGLINAPEILAYTDDDAIEKSNIIIEGLT